MKTNQSPSVIEIGQRAKLIRNTGNESKLCNYDNNYYGDQQCLTITTKTPDTEKNTK